MRCCGVIAALLWIATRVTPAAAQAGSAPVYSGVIQSTISSSGNTKNSSGTTFTWSLQQTLKLNVTLDTMPFPRTFRGTATGTVTTDFSYTEVLSNGCKSIRTLKYAGPYVPTPVWYNEGRPYVLITPFNTFELHLPTDYTADMVMSTRCSVGTPDLETRKVLVEWTETPFEGALDSAGAIEIHKTGVLKGFPNHVFSNIPAPSYSLDVRLSQEEEVEVVVEPENYQDWLPRGGADEKTPGNDINITATLQTKDEKTPVQQARKFRFELVDASRQPGVDINYPPSAKATRDADLKFVLASNSGMRSDTATDALIETPDGNYVKSSAVLTCYDWGAYGLIRVTAVLASGREVVGYLKGERGYTVIRIPKRQEGSVIADKWKQAKGVSGRPDNDDSEDDPVGDKAETGHTGDGLTLYEEYRGYHENGVHKDDLNPLRKDFFIQNRSGSNLRGIQLFAAATRLNVHHELQEDELQDRVINFNHAGDSLHQVDQHGVIIVVSQERKGSACAVPVGEACEAAHPSTPKYFKHVEMPTAGKRRLYRFGGVPATYLDLVLAHELLHTGNVYHHGDNDLGQVILAAKDVDGVLTPREYLSESEYASGAGTAVRLVREDGSEVAAANLVKPTRPYVGKEGGQHSGWEACLMRYDAAALYIREGSPNVRYVGGNERLGAQLCSVPDGTGVNDPDQVFPRPRFGNASAGRGRCRFQLCINDRYDHEVK